MKYGYGHGGDGGIVNVKLHFSSSLANVVRTDRNFVVVQHTSPIPYQPYTVRRPRELNSCGLGFMVSLVSLTLMHMHPEMHSFSVE